MISVKTSVDITVVAGGCENEWACMNEKMTMQRNVGKHISLPSSGLSAFANSRTKQYRDKRELSCSWRPTMCEMTVV